MVRRNSRDEFGRFDVLRFLLPHTHSWIKSDQSSYPVKFLQSMASTRTVQYAKHQTTARCILGMYAKWTSRPTAFLVSFLCVPIPRDAGTY
jgi:hypothetical protein